MEKVLNMTVGELLELGAKVDISFFVNATLEDAKETLIPFKEMGALEKSNRGGAYWVETKSENGKVSVVAFYDEEESDETETARALLTEQERKMKEAGHKESDFR